MAFRHLREPRGTMACTPRSNIKNTVCVSYIERFPTTRLLVENTPTSVALTLRPYDAVSHFPPKMGVKRRLRGAVPDAGF